MSTKGKDFIRTASREEWNHYLQHLRSRWITGTVMVLLVGAVLFLSTSCSSGSSALNNMGAEPKVSGSPSAKVHSEQQGSSTSGEQKEGKAAEAAEKVCDLLENAESLDELYVDAIQLRAQYPNVREADLEREAKALCPTMYAAWGEGDQVEQDQQYTRDDGVEVKLAGDSTVYQIPDGTVVEVTEAGEAYVLDGEGNRVRPANEEEKAAIR